MYKIYVEFEEGSLEIINEGPHGTAGTILDLLTNPKYDPQTIKIWQEDDV